MNLSKVIFKLSTLIPLFVVIVIVTFLIVSFFKLGHIPEYGIDSDPCTVFSDSFLDFKNWSLIVLFYLLGFSFFSLVTTFFIQINKIKRKEKILAIGIYAFGILLIALLRESSAFQWLVD